MPKKRDNKKILKNIGENKKRILVGILGLIVEFDKGRIVWN